MSSKIFTSLFVAFMLTLGGCSYTISFDENVDAEKGEEEVVIEEVVVDEDEPVEVDESEADATAEDIKAAFAQKYPDRNYDDTIFSIDTNSDNLFIEGTISEPEGGGAHYYSANVDGEWVIVVEAQDSVPCSTFEPYGFPSEMINNCF